MIATRDLTAAIRRAAIPLTGGASDYDELLDLERGELNLGQLARARHGRDAIAVGFTTYHGTVTAASDWGAPAERKRVRPALPGSREAVFHECGETGELPETYPWAV